MPTLSDAVKLATKLHAGQVDLGGVPYINHPKRVMARLHTTHDKILGVLHDVLEDTNITIDELRALGYSERIVEDLLVLTIKPGENYFSFIKRISASSKSCIRVKIADLLENTDFSRIPQSVFENLSRDVKARLQMYEKALKILEENL